MRIISMRKGYECNHSTRDYGYMSGIKVYYDYGTFDMTFTIPYNTELFRMLQDFKNIDASKKFNVIEITIRLYCEEYNEKPSEYVDLALDIRDAIIKKDKDVMTILDLYHAEKKAYNKFRPETELARKLKKDLTVCF
ncbi:MAG: hypothetical protein ABIG84_06275 [archaeon]